MSQTPFFDVDVPIEPPVLRSGQKGKNLEKKRRLREKILDIAGQSRIEEATREGTDSLVSITVEFRLWGGSPSTTATRPVKDLDNLTKVIFDTLKKGGSGERGLGIIEGDEYVIELHASKRLVNKDDEEGISIRVAKVTDEPMLEILRKYRSISGSSTF